MRTIALAFRNLWSRPLAALLNLVLLTLALASMTFLVLVTEQIDRALQRDLAGIDLVVGAKGSPMQLILAGVFQIDTAPGNIALKDVEALRRHPQVAGLIPLSMGDSFRGFRIVGTNQDYLALLRLRFAQGGAWSLPMQAVLGSQVAASTGMKNGDAFHGTHGMAGGAGHEDASYRVTGILAPCGCVADRLVLTSTESVWEVHEHAESGKAGSEEREVTMALVNYKTPLAAVTVPRWVNASTGMQAASPALEVSRLMRLLGVGTQVLRGVGAVLLLTGALGVFIALWNAVRERRTDLAMLRMLGATPLKVATLLLCEALWLAVMASVLGLATGHGLTELVGKALEAQRALPVTGAIWLQAEAWIPGVAVAVAFLAALMPAVTAYRVDVAQLLNAR